MRAGRAGGVMRRWRCCPRGVGLRSSCCLPSLHTSDSLCPSPPTYPYPLTPCSEEEMAGELRQVRAMWEMAAIIDFVHLFK